MAIHRRSPRLKVGLKVGFKGGLKVGFKGDPAPGFKPAPAASSASSQFHAVVEVFMRPP